jgi:AAA ATPase domain
MGALAPVGRIWGREAEIRALGEALARVAGGGPAVVLVEGEAGIGKTRLLGRVLADARGRGMRVAAGRAEELERTRPFGVLAAAFGCGRSAADPRRAAIAGLLASHGAGDLGPITVTSDPGLRFRVVDAFADLVEELALAGPLVLGLDDLQWADPSSLLTVGVLARRLTDLPVGVIGCLRPFPRGAELDRLAGALEAAGARHLLLRPLTGEEVAGLVAQVVAAEPGPRLLAEVAGAAGNPLFVTELLGALAQEGAIATAGGRAEVAQAVLPPTLRLTIVRRVSFLPEPALQALRSASVLGSGFTLTDLATVTGRLAVDLSVVLGEAIRARVLDDDGARLRFRHELIRDAIYADLAGSVRRALHREAGQRLARAGAPALQVAEHLAAARRPGTARRSPGWPGRPARRHRGPPRSPRICWAGRPGCWHPGIPAATGCSPNGPAACCGPGASPTPRQPAARCSTAIWILPWRAPSGYASGTPCYLLVRARDAAGITTSQAPDIRRSPFTTASTPRGTSPGPRPRCGSWASAAAATSRTAARKAAGTASPPASRPSSTWSPRDCPTPRSASGCTSHAGPCKPISRTCSPSFTSPPAPSSPPRRPGTGGSQPGDGNGPAATRAGRRQPAAGIVNSRRTRGGRTPARRPGLPVPRPVRECAGLRAHRRGPGRSRYQPAGRCLPGRCRRTLATRPRPSHHLDPAGGHYEHGSNYRGHRPA